MKKKYAGYIYSTRKTKDGYAWTIWDDNWKPLQTSLENEDKDEQHFKTQREAQINVIDAIEEFYD